MASGELPSGSAPASVGMVLGASMERQSSAQNPASSIIAGLQQGQHPFMTASVRPQVCDVVVPPFESPASSAGCRQPEPQAGRCWLRHTRAPGQFPHTCARAAGPALTAVACTIIRRAVRSSWTAGTCSEAALCWQRGASTAAGASAEVRLVAVSLAAG